MRWVVAQPGPSWSVHDVYIGWCEALKALGQDVHRFNLDDRLAFYSAAMVELPGEPLPDGRLRLRKALTGDQAIELAANTLAATLWKVRPHMLLVVCGFLIPADILDHARRHGTRVVVVHTEEPYEVDRELELAGHADLNLINDPTHLERFQAVAPTVYCPQAHRESLHRPGPPDPRLASDLAFVGTGFPSRRWFFEHMDLDNLDVLLAGNWNGVGPDSPLRKYLLSDDPNRCTDNTDTTRIYQSAQMSLNLYRREADDEASAAGWAMGPREVELAATGCFFLRDPRPEGDRVLSMLPTFTGPEDASEQARWWLAHPDNRAMAAGQAREAVADRTFGNHAKQLLRLLEQKE